VGTGILVLLILLIILALLVGGFVAFFLYSRTPAWRSSEVRMATMRLLVIIGPMFGVRVEMPPPDRPAVTTPGPDPPEGGAGAAGPPPAE
jgi:hypothetical protein